MQPFPPMQPITTFASPNGVQRIRWLLSDRVIEVRATRWAQVVQTAPAGIEVRTHMIRLLRPYSTASWTDRIVGSLLRQLREYKGPE